MQQIIVNRRLKTYTSGLYRQKVTAGICEAQVSDKPSLWLEMPFIRKKGCGDGIFFTHYGLFDAIHRSRQGKGIFGSRLASLVRWALNCRTCGDWVQSGSNQVIATNWGIGQTKQRSNKGSLAASQAENQKTNHLKCTPMHAEQTEGTRAPCPVRKL